VNVGTSTASVAGMEFHNPSPTSVPPPGRHPNSPDDTHQQAV